MSMQPVRARWFDGHSSQARAVMVGLHSAPGGASLVLHPLALGAHPLRLAHDQVGWPKA